MIDRLPSVLCCSGHDPTGGAGIQADIEAVSAAGLHAVTVITAHTVQDTRDVRRVSAVPPMMLAEQIAMLEQDCHIAAIKIGLLGDAEQVRVLVDAIRRLRVPVVLDPVLRAGGGANLVGIQLQAAVIEDLMPLVDVATPNLSEARRLAAPAGADAQACAARVLATGCRHVLITGGDEPGETVVNRWYSKDRPEGRKFEWPRLPATFHGAGCTLASALAARLARGDAVAAAIEDAQRWTQSTLARAHRIGAGRPIPNRR